MNKPKKVDLNLKHYIGDRSDVIKDIKIQISNFLRNSEIPDSTRSIYSAIYNALTYYQNISELSISGETADQTFLENTITEFNRDFEYLSKKYNSDDPTIPKVIQAKGRIKSPISAFEKILEKISEYIKDGMDLSLLNDSLRDFIGLRIIIDPPEHIKAQGKQAETDFCYQIFNDLLTYRGISRQISNEQAEDTDYHFITVDTVRDPHKLDKVKERPSKEGYLYNPDEFGIYIPTQRPEYVEQYDRYFKDYQMYPKARLYQRLHICANPYFSKYIPQQTLPNYIIPPKAKKPSIEYQVCLFDQEEWAERGKAAHTEYKGERSFHRLGIPIFMKFDENTGKIRLTRLDESMEEFYGYSFESMFNIDYQTFLRTFDASQRDDILAGKLNLEFDEETQEYILSEAKSVMILDDSQPLSCIQNILENATPEELLRFYESNGILDSTIEPGNEGVSTPSQKAIQVFTLQNPLDLEKKPSVIPVYNIIREEKPDIHDEH